MVDFWHVLAWYVLEKEIIQKKKHEELQINRDYKNTEKPEKW